MNINLMLRRYAAAMLDLMIGAIFIVVPTIILVDSPSKIFDTICICIGLTIVFLKDITGRSIGKRLLNLYIVDKSTRKKPKVWKLICRNLLLPLWIIDSLVCFGTKGQRVADMILKLEVIEGEIN